MITEPSVHPLTPDFSWTSLIAGSIVWINFFCFQLLVGLVVNCYCEYARMHSNANTNNCADSSVFLFFFVVTCVCISRRAIRDVYAFSKLLQFCVFSFIFGRRRNVFRGNLSKKSRRRWTVTTRDGVKHRFNAVVLDGEHFHALNSSQRVNGMLINWKFSVEFLTKFMEN